MARKAVAVLPPSSFELLARRIQRQIMSPRAQLERQDNIHRMEDELEEDWALLLEQIGEEETVTMTHREDGSVHLAWLAPRAY
ncbi:DUF1654 domain-containing protein [Pseudomonas sp. PDM16]|uniref:DUF1654 domain-containing protein n=1 Tax=Pseudomonas sp. PDM16 TaxID=2769292 RepID=UPI00177BBC46|nr:DUF1654 domain-containing protein [Pseudomonas sp. PDM16]MBD9415902.1 DUF1654 domain-containing protein [Pseudomonas sp. PDM16]